MIGFLSGIPVVIHDQLLLMVGGVGYDVKVGPTILPVAAAKAHQKDQLDLFIYTHVREEQLELYGFETLDHKSLFLMLLGVSGVGPKTALVLTDRGYQPLVTAVQQADVSFFTGVPRVGKKLGQKIIIELKSKLGSLQELSLASDTPQRQDIRAALTALGFAEREIEKGLQMPGLDEMTLEVAVKSVIKYLTAHS